jgi:hypothetical protein
MSGQKMTKAQQCQKQAWAQVPETERGRKKGKGEMKRNSWGKTKHKRQAKQNAQNRMK